MLRKAESRPGIPPNVSLPLEPAGAETPESDLGGISAETSSKGDIAWHVAAVCAGADVSLL